MGYGVIIRYMYTVQNDQVRVLAYLVLETFILSLNLLSLPSPGVTHKVNKLLKTAVTWPRCGAQGLTPTWVCLGVPGSTWKCLGVHYPAASARPLPF